MTSKIKKPSGQKAEIRYWVKEYYRTIADKYRKAEMKIDFTISELLEKVQNDPTWMDNWNKFLQGDKDSKPTIYFNGQFGIDKLGFGTTALFKLKKPFLTMVNKICQEFDTEVKFKVLNVDIVDGAPLFTLRELAMKEPEIREVTEDEFEMNYEMVKQKRG